MLTPPTQRWTALERNQSASLRRRRSPNGSSVTCQCRLWHKAARVNGAPGPARPPTERPRPDECRASRRQFPFVQRDRRIGARIDDDIHDRRDVALCCGPKCRAERARLFDADAVATTCARDRGMVDRAELAGVSVVAVQHVFRVPLVTEYL